MESVFVRVCLGFIFGWFIGFLMTRSVYKIKYEPQGFLHIAYDPDEPGHPKMGLEIESLDDVLSNDSINLVVKKIGFPGSKGPIFLQNSKDRSA